MKSFSSYISEAEVEATSREGMLHLQKMKDVEFIDFIKRIKGEMQGKLKNLSVSLKVDGGGCVSHDGMLDTLEYGRIPIGDVVERRLPCHVKSWDGVQVVYKRVLNYMVQSPTDTWYEMEIENGVTLKLTGEHLVYLPQLDCWRRMDELVVGDDVLFKG